MQTKSGNKISYKKRCLAALAGALFGLGVVNAEAGELWLATPDNFNFTGGGMELFVYGAAGTTGTVTSGLGLNVNFSIGASGTATIGIPQSHSITADGTVGNNGINIFSANPISAHYLNNETNTTDMTYLLDASSLGTEYYNLSFNAIGGRASQMTLVATEDNTTVTITPSASTNTGQTAGTPFNVTLNKGQTVKYEASAGSSDLTGSHIVADKAIGVFGGHFCGNVLPGDFACDHMISQLPSVDNLATSFVIAKTEKTGAAGNVVRIVASADNTAVFVDGVQVATLNAGQTHQISALTNSAVITSDKPVLVGQYLKGQSATGVGVGDPAMSFVTGTDQWLDEYVLNVPTTTQIFENFLGIAIQTSFLNSLLLDGVGLTASQLAQFTQVGSSIYSAANLAINTGIHSILADVAFLVMMQGFASFDSYLTIAGATFSPGASPPPPSAPEPMTLALLTLGLAGLSIRRRRMR